LQVFVVFASDKFHLFCQKYSYDENIPILGKLLEQGQLIFLVLEKEMLYYKGNRFQDNGLRRSDVGANYDMGIYEYSEAI
jgi:hypothetical protein